MTPRPATVPTRPRTVRTVWLAIVGLLAALAVTLPAVPAAATAPTAGQFVSMPLTKLLNTKTNVGRSTPILASEADYAVNVLGGSTTVPATGVPASGVLAVSVQIASVSSTADGSLWAWPAGTTKPTMPTVSYNTGVSASNLAFVKIGTNNQIMIDVGPTGQTDVSIFITGYVKADDSGTAGAPFVPLSQSKLFDTADGTNTTDNPAAKIPQNGYRTIQVAGQASIPTAGVAAVALNIQTISGSIGGWVTAYPSDGTPATGYAVSVLANGDPMLQTQLVPLSDTGQITFYANSGAVHVSAAVEGYYLTGDSTGNGEVYVPIAGTRVANSVTGVGTTGKVTAGATPPKSIQVTGLTSIPAAGVDTVAVNITTLNANLDGYMTAWAKGQAQPTGVRSVLVAAGDTQTNFTFVPLSADGKLSIANSAGTADVMIDVVGYFQRPSTSGVSLTPAAGQFNPVEGKLIYSTTPAGTIDASGSASTVSIDNIDTTKDTTTPTPLDTGVPPGASAVALEVRAKGSFAGLVKIGDSQATADTSLAFPRNVDQNGFDIVAPTVDGKISVKIQNVDTVSGTMSKFIIRVHGYYTGADTTTAGSTYVGYEPQTLADTGAAVTGFLSNPSSGSPAPVATGKLNISTAANVPSPLTNIYHVQAAGAAGVPADGSASAVAAQIVVKDSTCGQAGFVLRPTFPSTTTNLGRTDYDGNFESGHNTQTFDIVSLPSSGTLDFFLTGCAGQANVVIRIVGYFVKPTWSTPGSTYVPIEATVPFQTQGAVGGKVGTAACDDPTNESNPDNGNFDSAGRLNPGKGCSFPILGTPGIPDTGVTGIAAEVIALDPSADGWLGLYPDDDSNHAPTEQYTGSEGRDSNFAATTYAALGQSDSLYIYNSWGSAAVNVVVRVHGYFRAPSVPDQAVSVTVARQSTTAYVDWASPAGDGGAAATGYRVTTSPATSTQNVGMSTESATVTSLDPGTTYTFLVETRSDVGASSGAVASEVPAAAPSAADEIEVFPGASPGAVDVSWAPPDSQVDDRPNSLTNYTVQLLSSGGSAVASQTVPANDLTASFGGLTIGSTYTATVTAANRFGTGPTAASGGSATAGAPDRPDEEELTALPGPGQLIVSWAAPATDPLTYTVAATPVGGGASTSITVPGSARTATVSGLSNGTGYDLRLTATNAIGSSYSQLDGAGSPGAVPSQASNVAITGLGGAVQVDWTPPAGEVDDYVVTLYDSANSIVEKVMAAGDSTSTVFDGLSNSASYHAAVEPENSIGLATSTVSSAHTAAGTASRDPSTRSVADYEPEAFDVQAPVQLTASEQAAFDEAVGTNEAEMDRLNLEGYTTADAEDPSNAYDSAQAEQVNTASNNTTGCGAPHPRCSTSYYVGSAQFAAANSTNGASNANYLWKWGRDAATMRNSYVLLHIGAPVSKTKVSGFGNSISWATAAHKCLWFYRGWLSASKHDSGDRDRPNILTLGLITNSAGSPDKVINKINAEHAEDAINTSANGKWVSERNIKLWSDHQGEYLVMMAGSDTEAGKKVPYGWSPAWAPLSWHRNYDFAQVNDVAFFSGNTDPDKFKETTEPRHWSQYKEWLVMGGYFVEGDNGGRMQAFPQEYSVPSFGDNWARLNRVVKLTRRKVSNYVGVLWGCEGPANPASGNSPSPGASYHDFVRATGIEPSHLSRQVQNAVSTGTGNTQACE